VWGVQKFQHYLFGRAFTLVCDNSALQYLNNGKNANSTLARYAMQLAQFDFKVKHKPGKLHTNADGLTRAHKPTHDEVPFSLISAQLEEEVDAMEDTLLSMDDSAVMLPAIFEA
jgi:hypothetical protein